MNDVGTIISQLEQQKAAIDRALSALKDIGGPRPGRPKKSAGPATKKTTRKRRRMSAEGRARIAEAAKRMWAAKRAAGSARKKTARKAPAKKAVAQTAA